MYDRGHKGSRAIACAGAFLAFLDATIVNIAFPDISASFAGSGRDALSWVLDGYFVVIAALLVPAGGLADRFGHKRHLPARRRRLHRRQPALRAGAVARPLLIAFRVVQGIGAAMIAPTSLALVLDSFPAENRARRRRPLGRGRGGRGGGGADPGRRPGRALRLAPRLPRQPAARRRRASGSAATALRERRPTRQPPARPARRGDAGPQPGAGHARRSSRATTGAGPRPPTLGCFAASALLLGGIVFRSRTHPRPIVEPALFRHGSFRVGNLGTLLFAAAFFSLILGNVLFLTSIWGYTVLQAGAATLPGPTLSTVVAGPAGKLADRFGHRAVIVPGTLFFAAGVMVLRSAGADARLARPLAARRLPHRHRHRPRLPDPRRRLGARHPRRPLRHRQRRQRRLPPGRRRARHRDPRRDRRRTGDPAGRPRRLRRRLPLRRHRRARLRRRSCSACAGSERQALSAVPRPTMRLRSPAAISIVLPPTSPIRRRRAPPASRARR